MVEFQRGVIMLSVVSTSEECGIHTIDVVAADNDFFFHKQIQRVNGFTFMRMKKRKIESS